MDTLTLNYVKTATAIATFLVSERLEATVTNIRRYFDTPANLAAVQYERRIFDPRLRYSVTTTNLAAVQFEQPEEVAFIAKLLADPDLLDNLAKAVDEQIIDYQGCLRVSAGPQERKACDQQAHERVCEILNLIHARNEEDLPTEYLKDAWEIYRCQG